MKTIIVLGFVAAIGGLALPWMVFPRRLQAAFDARRGAREWAMLGLGLAALMLIGLALLMALIGALPADMTPDFKDGT